MADFQSVARRYCELVESAGSLPAETFAARAADALVEVYREGSRLPEMDPDTDAMAPGMPSAQWRALFEDLERCLGDGVLADALADVYRDLAGGFALMERGASPADVLWHWQFTFESHWGTHATEAIRRLHERAEAR